LLYDQGFTISGARNRLDEIVAEPARSVRAARTNLASLRRELKSVIEVLRG
jgi:septum formation topological specificity factor MinE